MERVGNTVYEKRHAAGLTQEELAKGARVSRQTIIAIEKGNYAPSVALALRLARVLKTRVEDLFTIV
ncbi:MAG: helix-turn-helix transcriptional regulator [Patescibacteria group bacterium]|nr:helix-turn-helix transcriptional regulator [Patescibacteria group bacterium]MDE1944003.1 helix-turn-helix transcriptional regulator [Patescibacteria group bacterium]MDE1945149.1 helix-turn-helix transcriptional regulator [Patescibacteria group bacterium]MDE2057789.1 helix-turn-helix transcriptional regulator [Patescibacteria group bacterium]